MTIDELRDKAEGLGIDVDKRWNQATLQKRIADAETAAGENGLDQLEGGTVTIAAGDGNTDSEPASGIKAADHVPVAPEARPKPLEADPEAVDPNTIVFTGDQASLLHANQKQRTFDALRRDEAREAADAAGKAAYDAVTNGLNARNRHAARKAARRLGFAAGA